MLLLVAIRIIILLSVSLFFGKSCGREGGPPEPKKIFMMPLKISKSSHEN